MIDMEISLVKAFSWSLREIDETDIVSMVEFIFRWVMPEDAPAPGLTYCDQVPGL